MKWKLGLAALGLAVIAGVAVLGIGFPGSVAQAQEPPDDGKEWWHSRYQELLAEKLGVTLKELDAARSDARGALIDEALESGRITEAQAERLRNAEPGDFRRGIGPRVRHFAGRFIESVAEILGLTPEEVRGGFRDGKSLSDLAAEQGVDDLADQLVDRIRDEIQDKVTDGTITRQQADRLLENLEERVAGLVEHEGTFPGRPGPRGFGPPHQPSGD